MNKKQSQNSSQNSKRGKFMRISLKLLEMIDFNKPYELQLALTLLFQGQAMSIAWDERFSKYFYKYNFSKTSKATSKYIKYSKVENSW